MKKKHVLLIITILASLFASANGSNRIPSKDGVFSSRDSIIIAIHRQVDLLRMAGGEDNIRKIDELLKGVADADTTYLPAVLEYADFLKHHNIEKSLDYYLIYQRGSINSINSYIDGLIKLSDAYFRLHKYDKDEDLLLQGLHLAQLEAKSDTLSEIYLNATSQIYSQLAQMYSSTDVKRHEEALVAAEKGLEAFRLLSEIDSIDYMDGYACCLKIGGDNYHRMGKNDLAKQYLSKAIQKFEYLYNEDPKKYRAKLAWAISQLAAIYKAEKDKANARIQYSRAGELFYQAMKHDPLAYEIYYARTMHNAASVCEEREERLNIYLLVSRSFDRLHELHPEMYLRERVVVYKNISNVAIQLGKWQLGIDAFESALDDMIKYVETAPSFKHDLLGFGYADVAKAYIELKKYDEALMYLNKSIENLGADEDKIAWCKEQILKINQQAQ